MTKKITSLEELKLQKNNELNDLLARINYLRGENKYCSDAERLENAEEIEELRKRVGEMLTPAILCKPPTNLLTIS